MIHPFSLRLSFVCICVLALLLAGGRASEIVGAPEITVMGTGATVKWRTDTAAGTRVSYGTAPDQLTQSMQGGVTDSHEVAIGGLQPGTKYFFVVGTARKKLATGQFTTSTSGTSVASPASSSPTATAPAPPKPKPLLAKIFSPAQTAPPTRQTWGNTGSLQDHFNRHGADFHAQNPDDYARMAWEFRQRAKAGELLAKVDETGVQRVFDPKTGAFAAYNRDGTTKTFFKPGSRDYFERQPGRPVKSITP